MRATDPDGVSLTDLTPPLLEPVIDLLTEQTVRRALARGRTLDPDDPGVHAAARAVVEPALDPSSTHFCLVDVDPAGVAGVVTGLVSRLTPDDVGYTYLPPRHTLAPVTGWAVRADLGPDVLTRLVHVAAGRSRALGLDRLSFQVLDGDVDAVSAARVAGLRPDTVFALRPLALAPGRRPSPEIRVRPAEAADLPALVDLSLEEQTYHARHTGSGMAHDQDRATVTRVCRGWLEHGSDPLTERAVVAAQADDGPVVGVTTMAVLETPATALSSFLLPRRYGYIGLTSVARGQRGRGVGTALAEAALAWMGGTPDPPQYVGLHYVADNVLSAGFWPALGWVGVTTILTDAAPHPATRPAGPDAP